MTQNIPPELPDGEVLRTMHTQAEDFLKENPESEASPSILPSLECNQLNASDATTSDSECSKLQEDRLVGTVDSAEAEPSQDGGDSIQESNSSVVSSTEATVPPQSSENGSQSPLPGKEKESQVIEQFEPGVYVTLTVRPSGHKVFKRVRFRYLLFLHVHPTNSTFPMSNCQVTPCICLWSINNNIVQLPQIGSMYASQCRADYQQGLGLAEGTSLPQRGELRFEFSLGEMPMLSHQK